MAPRIKRPPSPPDLLDIARAQIKFGENHLAVISLIFSTLRRGLKLLPDTDDKEAMIHQMVGELMDLNASKISDGLVAVQYPKSDAERKAKEPEPKNKPGLAVPDRPHR